MNNGPIWISLIKQKSKLMIGDVELDIILINDDTVPTEEDDGHDSNTNRRLKQARQRQN